MKKKKIGLLLTICMLSGLIGGCGGAPKSGSSARMANNEVQTDSSREENREPLDKAILAYGSSYSSDGIWIYDMDGKKIADRPDLTWEGYLSEGKFVFFEGDKYGVMSINGDIIADPIYDRDSYRDEVGYLKGLIYQEGLAVIVENGKCGYMDEKGNIVIEPQFDRADRFSSGLARVKIGEKYGYIDPSGNIVIEAEYKYAGSFSNGLAQIEDSDGEWGIINTAGELVQGDGVSPVSPISYTFDFHDGLALVEVDQHYGYINEAGEMAIEPIFTEAYPFIDGIARVQVYLEDWGSVYGYINTEGEYVIEPQFRNAQDFSDGLAYVSYSSLDDSLDKAYIDTSGNPVIEFDSDSVIDAFPFSDGMALVHETTEEIEAYYIDKQGNKAVDLAALETGFGYYQGEYTGGYAVLMLDDGKCKLIDKEGNFVFDGDFTTIYDDYIESDGIVILYMEDGNKGVARLDGSWVVEPGDYEEICIVNAENDYETNALEGVLH